MDTVFAPTHIWTVFRSAPVFSELPSPGGAALTTRRLALVFVAVYPCNAMTSLHHQSQSSTLLAARRAVGV